ncbi:MAG: class I SAM-dependent methyltransferase [Chloroflexi bacterium]|nr:class I SAM-dependent methyltransferase [Chloroflexota bacterium]
MRADDRFDDLVASLSGHYRSWLVYLGLELGLFERLRAAREPGLTAAELATAAQLDAAAVAAWAWAAEIHDLVATDDAGRTTLDEDLAAILLDDDRPEFLGGQVRHAVVSTLDWDRMPERFRTGLPLADRPDRYREAIERLTVQDIAVFFAEVLGQLPQLVADLSSGGRVLDVHCGGGRWLVAMARRFPGLTGVGVEFEPDSVARARATIAAAGLADRLLVEQADVSIPGQSGEFDLAYFQYALHGVPDPIAALRAAWMALRPGASLLVLDWPLPDDPEEAHTVYGALIAGVHLDELLQGEGLASRGQVWTWFGDAGLAEPEVLELPSGATAWLATKPA